MNTQHISRRQQRKEDGRLGKATLDVRDKSYLTAPILMEKEVEVDALDPLTNLPMPDPETGLTLKEKKKVVVKLAPASYNNRLARKWNKPNKYDGVQPAETASAKRHKRQMEHAETKQAMEAEPLFAALNSELKRLTQASGCIFVYEAMAPKPNNGFPQPLSYRIVAQYGAEKQQRVMAGPCTLKALVGRELPRLSDLVWRGKLSLPRVPLAEAEDESL